MAGIYSRDQINYGGMLGNAMAAKANYLKNRYDRVADIGRTWGGAVSNFGQALQNALNQYAQQQYNREQQAWQAEQNALNREDVLKRAREQQAWQAGQNRLQRESTEYIAGLNQQQAQAEKQAQNMLNFNNAEAGLEYAKQAVDAAKKSGDIDKMALANRDLQIAQNKYDYYKGLVPFDTKVDQDAVNEEILKEMTAEPTNEVPQSQAVKIQNYSDLSDFATETEKNEILNEIKTNPNYGQDKALQEQFNRLSKIKPREVRVKEFNEKKDKYYGEAKAAQDKGPASYRNWKRTHKKEIETYKLELP